MPGLFDPHASSWRFFAVRSGDDWSFYFPNPFASEQHSRLAFAAKLALLQRSVKINVPKKQQLLRPITSAEAQRLGAFESGVLER